MLPSSRRWPLSSARLVEHQWRLGSTCGYSLTVEMILTIFSRQTLPARVDDRKEFPGRNMIITRIVAYRVELPLHEGSYKWSGGKSVDVFDSTIVRVETDTGLAGHGEVCPLGPAYLPAYPEGVRAGIAMLAPRRIGEDPRELERLNRTMDAALKGHPYVKS